MHETVDCGCEITSKHRNGRSNCGSTIVAELPWTFGVEGEGAGLLIF